MQNLDHFITGHWGLDHPDNDETTYEKGYRLQLESLAARKRLWRRRWQGPMVRCSICGVGLPSAEPGTDCSHCRAWFDMTIDRLRGVRRWKWG